MRVMNGRLYNLVRSPLNSKKLFNNNFVNQSSSPLQKYNKNHHNRHYKRGSRASSSSMHASLRRQSSDTPLPKPIQFDESSDEYRCLCGCFHVKTGAFCIAGKLFFNSIIIR